MRACLRFSSPLLAVAVSLGAVVPAASVGCGGGSSGNAGGESAADAGGAKDSGGALQDGATEGGTAHQDAAVDAPPPIPYPAVAPDIGGIVNHGGGVLKTPKVVTVTWSDDPTAAALQDFGDKLGASKFWAGMTEYGVGPTTSGKANHVVIDTPPPAVWADSDIESWVVTKLGDAPGNGWPVPDAETIYIIYTPANIQVTSGGTDACPTYDGYHDELQVGDNAHVVFALVVGDCAAGQELSVQDSDTSTAAHEIVEAATDPHVDSTLGWTGFDKANWAWEIFNDAQDELADACEDYYDAYYTGGADLPYALQRYWSNASAKAGHDPCVPLPAGAYYSVTALDPQAITATIGSPSLTQPEPVKTKGYRIPVGQSATFRVELYSDEKTGPWTVEAVEGDGVDPPTPSILELSQNKKTGSNGDVIEITVKVKAAPGSGWDASLLSIVSTKGGTSHYLPVLIGTE